MADKELETFKIGDTRKPGIDKPKKAEEPQPESQSLGFKRIEGILETEEPAAISSKLSTLAQGLQEFEKTAKGNKDKSAAKKAIVAVERTADLMTYLFQTKESLVNSAK